jgi:hypothetical protein
MTGQLPLALRLGATRFLALLSTGAAYPLQKQSQPVLGPLRYVTLIWLLYVVVLCCVNLKLRYAVQFEAGFGPFKNRAPLVWGSAVLLTRLIASATRSRWR